MSFDIRYKSKEQQATAILDARETRDQNIKNWNIEERTADSKQATTNSKYKSG